MNECEFEHCDPLIFLDGVFNNKFTFLWYMQTHPRCAVDDCTSTCLGRISANVVRRKEMP